MKNALRIGILVLTPLLLLAGLHQPDSSTSVMYISGQGAGMFNSSRTPEAAVTRLLENIKLHHYHEAYQVVDNINEVDERDFTLDTRGAFGDLRSFSGLEDYHFHVLRKNDREAVVRTTFQWSTAVGEDDVTRDLKLVNRSGEWKVIWPAFNLPQVAPQVIPVNYSAWNVIWHGGRGGQGPAPQVRVSSMTAIAHGDATVVLGEIRNDDSVPASVDLEGSLIGANGDVLATENPFDKMLHVLLPGQSTPFRLDFPGVSFSNVKKVRLQPSSALVSASSDPQINVEDPRLEVDARGRSVLTGSLNNESGRLVQIPHIVAACYDRVGKVVWVASGYVDKPLLPQSEAVFAVDVPNSIATQVATYRVAVNEYSTRVR
jgi:hypothetical protein